jgi:hypothetical protein
MERTPKEKGKKNNRSEEIRAEERKKALTHMIRTR